MDAADAAAKADTILANVIEHQQNLLPTGSLNYPDTLAVGLATLRSKLIEELKKQPE